MFSSLLQDLKTKKWSISHPKRIYLKVQDQILISPTLNSFDEICVDKSFIYHDSDEISQNTQQMSADVLCFKIFNDLTDASFLFETDCNFVLHASNLFETELSFSNLNFSNELNDNSQSNWFRVPIIESKGQKREDMNSRLRDAVISNPFTNAIIIRDHGAFIWGKTIEEIQRNTEKLIFICQLLYEQNSIDNIPQHFFPSQDPLIRAWYMINTTENDQTDSLQPIEPEWVSCDKLRNIGILHWKLTGDENDCDLQMIRDERKYNNHDIICLNKRTMDETKYNELLKKFCEEHLHEDEEIRYIMDGSGYFDVRDQFDRWIRIHVVKGDMIVLPEGIYHRFIPDKNAFIQAMRLFRGVPSWIGHSRKTSNEMVSRARYLGLIGFISQYSNIKLILWDFDWFIKSLLETTDKENNSLVNCFDSSLFRSVILYLKELSIDYRILSSYSSEIELFFQHFFGSEKIVTTNEIYSIGQQSNSHETTRDYIESIKNLSNNLNISIRSNVLIIGQQKYHASLQIHGFKTLCYEEKGFLPQLFFVPCRHI